MKIRIGNIAVILGLFTLAFISPNILKADPATITNQPYVHLSINGVAGTNYTIQRTTNIANPEAWESVTNFIMDTPPVEWVERQSFGGDSAFYRVLPFGSSHLMWTSTADTQAAGTSQIVASSFVTGTNNSWITRIGVYIHEAQNASITLHLYTNSNGKPGSELYSFTTNITTGIQWAYFTNVINLAQNSRYWIGFTSSGATTPGTLFGVTNAPLSGNEGYTSLSGILTRGIGTWTSYDATNTLIYTFDGYPTFKATTSMRIYSHLTITGTPGTSYTVSSSDTPNSTNGTILTRLTLVNGTVEYIDKSTLNTSKRYYSIQELPFAVIQAPNSPLSYGLVNFSGVTASSFTTDTNSWQVSSFKVFLYYPGTYSYTIHIYEDGNGAPGSEIYTIDNNWNETVSSPQPALVLAPNTTYWYGFELTSTVTPENGFVWLYYNDTNKLFSENGFVIQPGVMKRTDGPWQTLWSDRQMAFEIYAYRQ